VIDVEKLKKQKPKGDKMNQLLKLHLGLIKYLSKELPKKKFREGLKLLISIIPMYLKELLKLYKNLFLVFDKEYQIKKKQFDKMQRLKIDLKRSLKMLQYVDKKMTENGINRTARRQFWRDFYKDGQVRNEVFENLLRELDTLK
jgi:hypothetical protein